MDRSRQLSTLTADSLPPGRDPPPGGRQQSKGMTAFRELDLTQSKVMPASVAELQSALRSATFRNHFIDFKPALPDWRYRLSHGSSTLYFALKVIGNAGMFWMPPWILIRSDLLRQTGSK